MRTGVYGSAGGITQEELREMAREVGRQVALAGHEIITGGCPGYPYDAVLGSYEEGGICIAYSPATDMKTHKEIFGYPVEGFAEFVFVPKEIPVHYINVNDVFIPRKLRDVASVVTTTKYSMEDWPVDDVIIESVTILNQ